LIAGGCIGLDIGFDKTRLVLGSVDEWIKSVTDEHRHSLKIEK